MVQRCLRIFLCLAICAVNTLTVSAFTIPNGAAQSVRVYLNPNTGRFWTRDSYEGSQSDPLSLHKYLYCQVDPVNGIDPSGEFTEAIGVMMTFSISTVLDGLPNLAPMAEVKVGTKVEVRFGKLNEVPSAIGDWYHAYIITTDNLTGNMGLFRGQPSKQPYPRPTTPQGWLTADFGVLTTISQTYNQKKGADSDPENKDPSVVSLK
jgi:hypothetical protein